MSDTVTIRLAKENMKFSAAHFTIFNASERERLHGHNFRVEVDIEARMLGNGMCFDYGIFGTHLGESGVQADIRIRQAPALRVLATRIAELAAQARRETLPASLPNLQPAIA